MGLCKCPKRRVTNQFCFEHRVNVCEYCMVTNHPKCIIQSYLQWLQDSDYKPICEFCSKELTLEDCIRLSCYHVFHWSCFDQYARKLPSTTAPAGYTCPSCKCSLFPSSNVVSPVVDVLREKLAGVNWARAGLGLPLLSEDREIKPSPSLNNTSPAMSNNITSTPHSVVHVEDQIAFNRSSEAFSTSSRKIFHDEKENRNLTIDHDDDKYKRRPAGEWVRRWWKNMATTHPLSRSGGSIYKRYCMLAILLVLGITVILLIMSRLGRYTTENDPNFDPLHNSQIRVEDGKPHSV
ncbi:zinc finger protein-like 1 homolog [Agrilus planipennis]|uniref:Zinc finger protein-like 1 homolog n=1 Tax=Agrilus planipennis TaxID=224129 RepID=A0A1W4XM09_AGRPL|nr:zinc finger protein-like 1 homolog [Agrilus planipennis]